MTEKLSGEDPELIRISATTLGDMLLNSYDRAPGKLAVCYPDASVTYGELVEKSLVMARGIVALGIKPRAHVGIMLTTGVQFVETLFAITLAGCTSVLINSRYRPSELAYVAENADLAAIITSDEHTDHVDFVGKVNEALPELAAQQGVLALAAAPKLRHVVLLGGATVPGFVDQTQFDAAAATVSRAEIHHRRLGVRVRDTCMILYTSGTSANPKGCLLSHEAVTREAMNLGRNRWRFDETERVWSPMPLFHVAALLGLLSVLDAGGTFYGQPHFEPGASLHQIEQDRVTMLFLPFVTFHQAMIGHPDFASTDMSSIRLMNSCFAAMPDAVGRVYRSKVPHTLQVGTFGMTEATGIVATGGYGMDPELGFSRLGFPLAGIDVRIVDRETGTDLPVGEQGEVLIRGYNLFDGYYRDPVKTAEALDEDGWYHSGDIGSVDAQGHIMFHGRTKDMLKVGGENVAAAEVEAVLQRHPGVKLAQVVGIPDQRLAEVPAAYVERDGGVKVDEAELIAFVRSQVASFKVPRHVRFIEEWPMSASKIQKFKLRRELMGELGIQD
jgi:fatty-acyl-CoA synthase/long-chain acyl-CoA synthetase